MFYITALEMRGINNNQHFQVHHTNFMSFSSFDAGLCTRYIKIPKIGFLICCNSLFEKDYVHH